MIKTAIATGLLAILAIIPTVQAEPQTVADTPCYQNLWLGHYYSAQDYVNELANSGNVTEYDRITVDFVTRTITHTDDFVQCTINDFNP